MLEVARRALYTAKRILRPIYCTHEPAATVIWNQLHGDEGRPSGTRVAVAWCPWCGAIKKTLSIPDGAGGWAEAGFPTGSWELPDQANGRGVRPAYVKEVTRAVDSFVSRLRRRE